MKIDVSHAEKQTDRTSWTIQTPSDELYRARRRTFHEVNSLSLVLLIKVRRLA